MQYHIWNKLNFRRLAKMKKDMKKALHAKLSVHNSAISDFSES
jgi:hypothetical protein